MATPPATRENGRCVCEKAARSGAEGQSTRTDGRRNAARLECYVVHRGNCGGLVPTATTPAQLGVINISRRADGDDASGAIGGNCTPVDPPTHACMGATSYRDECTLDLCEAECAD